MTKGARNNFAVVSILVFFIGIVILLIVGMWQRRQLEITIDENEKAILKNEDTIKSQNIIVIMQDDTLIGNQIRGKKYRDSILKLLNIRK